MRITLRARDCRLGVGPAGPADRCIGCGTTDGDRLTIEIDVRKTRRRPRSRAVVGLCADCLADQLGDVVGKYRGVDRPMQSATGWP